jgi:hypothetical protein
MWHFSSKLKIFDASDICGKLVVLVVTCHNVAEACASFFKFHGTSVDEVHVLYLTTPKEHFVVPTSCVCVFLVIFTINSHYSPFGVNEED